MADSCFYALTILATVEGKIAPDEEIRTTCPGSVLTDDFLFEMVEMHIKKQRTCNIFKTGYRHQNSGLGELSN